MFDDMYMMWWKLKGSTADEKAFALIGNGLDLIIQLGLLVLQDGNSDHVSGGSASSSQSFLRFNEHIGDVLNES